MSRTRLFAGLAVAVVLLVGAALFLGGRGGTDNGGGESRGGAGAETSAGSGSSSGGTGAGEKANKNGASSESDPAGDLAPVTEVKPEARKASGAGAEGLPGIRPPRTGPLVSEPLPRSASSRGTLVAGHPSQVLPVVPGSKVRTSSVSTAGRTVQVALVGDAPSSQVSVARFYRVSLARLGFRESEVPAVGGSTGVGFRRGQDSVVLTTTPLGGKRCTFSLFGSLHAGNA